MLLVPAKMVWALDVPVRTGAHDEYSRLVFDWPKAATYTLKKTGDTAFEITFNQNAGLDDAKLKANPVSNISGVEVLSEEPLRISLTVSANSRVRDFIVGNRVIIDVYNPPGAKPAAKPLTVTQSEKKPEKTTTAPPKTEPSKIGLSEIKAKPNVIVDEAVKEPDTITLKPSAVPTLVTVSSTESFGLAVFENAGRLWIVNDTEDPLLNPQISGPKAEDIKLKEVQTKEATVYAGAVPEEFMIKGHGGGVLWRVIMSPDQKMPKPALPVRSDTADKGKIRWPLETARRVLELKDDLTGEKIFVVSVDDADHLAGAAQEFVEFSVLNSPVGLAVIPKVDDLSVKIIRGGVEISRPSGLSIVSEAKVESARASSKLASKALENNGVQEIGSRIFDFKSWKLGGLKALHENRNIILSKYKDAPDSAKIESLLTLAKAYLANGVGAEALGILGLAASELPGIDENTEFIALKGAARALGWQSEEAFRELSIDELKEFPEVHVWRAYVLADLGDWQQAAEVLPSNYYGILLDYPKVLRNLLALTTAEVLLRNGDTSGAGQLLAVVENDEKTLPLSQKSSLTYLKGEKARQQGSVKDTKKYWTKLLEGEDDLYRARAGLAITRLMMDEEKLSTGKSIDRLERLRYAWRGDDLEAQINYWLGRIYFNKGDYARGLNIMRDSISYASGSPLSQRIAHDISKEFIALFNSEKLDTVSPLDAIMLYEEFSELVPPDDRGNTLVERLSEHLVKADLLERAGDLLNHQINHRLEGYEAFRIATRLVAIRLLDNRPNEAIGVLNLAEQRFRELPEELQNAENTRNLALLRARALSKQGRPDQALAILSEMPLTPGLNRLRADIAWSASYWDDAGEALRDVILDENISLTRPLSEDNTRLLLQRAIALNLASDRVALANMREKYSDLMKQTEKAKVFEVITRPRKSGALADRETLLSIVSEVDLFTNVLSELKASEQ